MPPAAKRPGPSRPQAPPSSLPALTPGSRGRNDAADPNGRPGADGVAECKAAVSEELRDACAMPDTPAPIQGLSLARRKVLAWLRHYKKSIVAAEKKFQVDRRAVAGAIAWEALQNVKDHHFYSQWIGPGKIHLFNARNWTHPTVTLAGEVEEAGYLPKQSYSARKALVATPEGAITYIAACMKAIADVIAGAGYKDIYWERPEILAFFYNSKLLAEVKEHFATKKYPAPLDPGDKDKMGFWVKENLPYLEEAVGKPEPPATQKGELSGPQWVQKFPTSRSTADLTPAFRANVDRFVAALRAAGATVRISATYRPPERAYLMHYAWMIAREGLSPSLVPAKTGVNIRWVHTNAAGQPDLPASKKAAEEMVKAYQIVHKPSLTSRHTERRAIDMDIAWDGDLAIARGDGKGVTAITTTPRTGAGNHALHAVGASYGVIKLATDPPHWSDDGH